MNKTFFLNPPNLNTINIVNNIFIIPSKDIHKNITSADTAKNEFELLIFFFFSKIQNVTLIVTKNYNTNCTVGGGSFTNQATDFSDQLLPLF